MSFSMSSAKNALITTGAVLAVIFVLRQIGPTKGIVDKALGN